MTTPNPVRDCLSCGRPTARTADPAAGILVSGRRGLCRRCYDQHQRTKTLEQFPSRRNEGNPNGTCRDCGQERVMVARNLCSTCYDRHKHRGTLSQFPSLNPSKADIYKKWLELPPGLPNRQAAALIGCDKDTLRKAIAQYSTVTDAARTRPLVMELLAEPIFPTENAACVGENPSAWDDDGSPYARSVCATCPVRVACLEWALQYAEGGMWGGLTEKQRRELKRSRTRQQVAS